MSNEIYDKILANIKDVTIDFECKPNIKTGTLKNIVGKIAGQSSDRALVISCHYDAVGSLQDHIVNGAIDNASGVLTMLKTAKNLAEKYSGAIKPTFDIYFVAFNSEEIGLTGSEEFAKEFAKQYPQNVVNLNYDCFTNKKTIFLGNENESENIFYEELRKEFSENNIKYTDGIYSSTDHTNFKTPGNLAITIGEYTPPPKGFIHSLQDTADKVDTTFCVKVADVMSSYIYRKGGKLFDFIELISQAEGLGNLEDIEEQRRNSEKIDKEVEEVKKAVSLKFNEYYTFTFSEDKNTAIQIQGQREFKKLAEFAKVFKDVNISDIPTTIGNAEFVDITPFTSTIKSRYVTYPIDIMESNPKDFLVNVIPLSPSDFNKVMKADISDIEKVELSYAHVGKKKNWVTRYSVIAKDNATSAFVYFAEFPKQDVTSGGQSYQIYNLQNQIIDPVTSYVTSKKHDDLFEAFSVFTNNCTVYVEAARFEDAKLVAYTKEDMIEIIKSIPIASLEAITRLVR